MVRKEQVLAVGLLAVILISLAGCPISPPFGGRGRQHQYSSMGEIFRHIDHYYGKLCEQRTTFRTSIQGYNDLMLYCQYIQALCRQGRYRYGTDRPAFRARAVAVVQTVREITIRAGGLEPDKDHVPALMDELGRRIDRFKESS